MQRTRVKICGITRREDAHAAVAAGADAIGLVFYGPSPRAVTDLDLAAHICADLPPFVTVTGLFVNHSAEYVAEVVSRLSLGLLQFHGDEDAAFCESFGHPYIKAVRVRSATDVTSAEKDFPKALGLLADSYKKGVAGGTGETFDWDLIPEQRNKPLILAGGLNADNVRSAISCVHPYAVDVSGGVEQNKGVKDHAKLKRFIEEVSRGA